MRLDRHTDDDTWRGQRPLLCRARSPRQHQLHGAADDLRLVALRLDQQAESGRTGREPAWRLGDGGLRPRSDPGALRHTRDAIAATLEVRSSDPAAAHAFAAVRLLRQNLEDHWMPLMHDIERSEAMVSWTQRASSSRCGQRLIDRAGFGR